MSTNLWAATMQFKFKMGFTITIFAADEFNMALVEGEMVRRGGGEINYGRRKIQRS